MISKVTVNLLWLPWATLAIYLGLKDLVSWWTIILICSSHFVIDYTIKKGGE